MIKSNTRPAFRAQSCPATALLAFSVLALMFLLSACTLPVRIVLETPAAPAVEQVAPTALAACLPPGAEVEYARVARIVDGDTIRVEMDGTEYAVRYIGIDTPETKAPNTPVEYYGPEATQRNTELVENKDIWMVRDTSETDRNGRLLRYIFVDGAFVNETLVREGYAIAKAYPPDTACTKTLASAMAEAQQARRGMWQEGLNAPVAPTQAASGPSTGEGSACPQGCLEERPGCAIKGNINSRGDKIYHLPGSGSYAGTKIDAGKGERWFCSEAEAQANDWRAPGK
jgi:micrococcal nuclease